MEDGVDGQLKDVAGVLIPGGFGERGVEGKISAARFARENKLPYLGLCLGMQVATIEFARNVCGIEKANSTRVRSKRIRSGDLSPRGTARGAEQRRQYAARDLADKDSTRHVSRRKFTETTKCSSGIGIVTSST